MGGGGRGENAYGKTKSEKGNKLYLNPMWNDSRYNNINVRILGRRREKAYTLKGSYTTI